jgi:hypothetical protein
MTEQIASGQFHQAPGVEDWWVVLPGREGDDGFPVDLGRKEGSRRSQAEDHGQGQVLRGIGGMASKPIKRKRTVSEPAASRGQELKLRVALGR